MRTAKEAQENMMGGYDVAFKLTKGHEGRFTNDPKDPGNWTGGRQGSGELVGTMYGISAKAYPTLDIPNLTLDAAKGIYFTDYWQRSHCDELPDGLSYAVFDAAVNVGNGRAVRWLQEAAGTYADGKFGPATRAAITQASKDLERLIRDFHALRLVHYMELDRLNDRFGKGWARRVLDVHTAALSQAQL